jgi:hypothetical protein
MFLGCDWLFPTQIMPNNIAKFAITAKPEITFKYCPEQNLPIKFHLCLTKMKFDQKIFKFCLDIFFEFILTPASIG